MKSILKKLAAVVTLVMGLGTMTPAMAHDQHEHSPLMHHLVFKGGALHAHVTFNQEPAASTSSGLTIEFKDPKTHTATDITEQVQVVLWMPNMGHGSAPTVVQKALDPQGQPLVGTYNVSNVYFIMSGDWEVRVILTNAQGTSETESFNITIDGGEDNGHHHNH